MSDTVLLSVKDMINRSFGDPNVNVVNFKLIQAVLLLFAKQLRVLERTVGVESDLVTGMSPKSVISVTEVKVMSKKLSATSMKSAAEGRGTKGRGAEGRGAEGRGAEGRGAEGRGAEGRGAEGSGAEGRGAEGRGAEGRGAGGKGAGGKGAGSKGAEGRDAEGRDVESRGAEGKGADGRGGAGKGAEGRDAEGKGSEGRGAGGKGAGGRGAEGKGAEGKSAEGKGTGGKDAEGRDAEGRGAGGKGAGGKGAGGKGAGGKGGEGRGGEGGGAQGKYSESSDNDGRGADARGAEGRGAGGRGADGRGADGRGADGRGADGRGADGRGTGGRGADGRGADGRGADGRGADGRGADGRGADGRGADGRGTDGRGADGKDFDERGAGGRGAAKTGRLSRDASYTDTKSLRDGKFGKGKGSKTGIGKRTSEDGSEEFNYERLFIVEKIPDDTKAPKDNILSVVGEKDFKALVNRVHNVEQFLAMEGGMPIHGVEMTPADNVKFYKVGRQGEYDADVKSMKSIMSTGGLSTKSAQKGGLSRTTSAAPSKSGGISGAGGSAIATGVVTFDELNEIMSDMRRTITNQLEGGMSKMANTVDHILKLNTKTEAKMSDMVAVSQKVDQMDEVVGLIRDQVDTLDSGLSAQIVLFQEQLTQLQHDLEAGMESMAESITNQGDANAILEIIQNLQNLQNDFDKARGMHQELDEQQRALQTDIRAILKDMEFLREAKSDRDEVADALRDKAGIADLNGMVSVQHFEAVQEYFEKKIEAAYNKFYAYELRWQQAIDDIYRAIELKADRWDLEKLRENIQSILNDMNAKLYEISEILGEPRAAALERALFRDTTCLSCLTPAKGDLKKPILVPMQPPLRNKQVEKLIREDGDHPDAFHTNPNPEIPERQYCSRYCGGSHTLINRNRFKVQPHFGPTITSIVREPQTGMGSDGQLYRIDDELCPCFFSTPM